MPSLPREIAYSCPDKSGMSASCTSSFHPSSKQNCSPSVASEVFQSRTHMQEHMEDVDDEEEEDDDDDVF